MENPRWRTVQCSPFIVCWKLLWNTTRLTLVSCFICWFYGPKLLIRLRWLCLRKVCAFVFFLFPHLFSVVYEACLFVDGSGLEYVQFVCCCHSVAMFKNKVSSIFRSCSLYMAWIFNFFFCHCYGFCLFTTYLDLLYN